MCLIALNWQPNSNTPMTLLANRDEFFDRPTRPPHRWANGMFAGKDEQSGGTWLGISANGRFAAVTNFREPNIKTGRHSRGKLVTDFLNGTLSPERHLEALEHQANDYSGFNLLIGAENQLGYFSNRGGQARLLAPGYYVLSNAHLDSPWPKAVKLKAELEASSANMPLSDLLPLLQHACRAADHELPVTGVDPSLESRLSSAFIQPFNLHGKIYGTRNSTAIRTYANGNVDWVEWVYNELGVKEVSNHQWQQDEALQSQSKLAISASDK